MNKAGIRLTPGMHRPRLHDLRHTFAVRALSRLAPWAVHTGKHMVALATYMGHVNVFATYWYLEATADLIRGDVRGRRRNVPVRWSAIMTLIAPFIETFLFETLSRHRGVQPAHMQLLCLQFPALPSVISGRISKFPPSTLTLEQLDSGLISAFLEYLEDRNRKMRRKPAMSVWRQSIPFSTSWNIGSLRPWSKSAVYWQFLSRNRYSPGSFSLAREFQALLDAGDPTIFDEIRNSAMLHLAVCAGLRVSELTGLRTPNVDVPSMSIRILGKGRRERMSPPLEAYRRRLFPLGSQCVERS